MLVKSLNGTKEVFINSEHVLSNNFFSSAI